MNKRIGFVSPDENKEEQKLGHAEVDDGEDEDPFWTKVKIIAVSIIEVVQGVLGLINDDPEDK